MNIVWGVPTEPDVERLRKAFPVPTLTEGLLLKHEDVEAVINIEGDCPKGSSRYKTVTLRWRNECEALHKIRIGAEPGVGFKVLSPSERLVESEGHTVKAVRQAKKAHFRSSVIDRNRLEPEEQKRAEHVQCTSATILAHARLLANSAPRPEATES